MRMRNGDRGIENRELRGCVMYDRKFGCLNVFSLLFFLLVAIIFSGCMLWDIDEIREKAWRNGGNCVVCRKKPCVCKITVFPPIIELVYIESGTFTMGSSDELAFLAQPPHQVTISKSFCMGKYEVTQEQYQAVTGVNPGYFSNNLTFGETQGRRPVEMVTWYDAAEFCNKLSDREGLNKVYTITNRNPINGYPIESATVTADWDANGYRLPTEAEWEYACRAGTITAYNTGDTISDETGWYLDNSYEVTHEVGLKTPNGWGLHDMHGNVNEWCWDWYGLYENEDQIDPIGADSGTNRILRGGSWRDNSQALLSANRIVNSPDGRNNLYGFRVVRLYDSTAVITNQTPVTSDFEIGNLFQPKGSVTPVTITAKAGKSTGAITVFYNGLNTIPQAEGMYKILFNIEASLGWNEVYDLEGGNLVVYNDLYYTQGLNFALINNDTAYSVSRGTASDAVVVIPTVYNELPVTEIDSFGFDNYIEMTGIIIPNSITVIGDGAFVNCINLSDIKIPGSVTNMGVKVFSYCHSLTNIILSESMTVISAGLFDYCTGLKSVNIPESITDIGDGAFFQCSSLTTIFYGGTDDVAWNNIEINYNNIEYLVSAARYYYSAAQPSTSNTHWRFVDGVPVIWIF